MTTMPNKISRGAAGCTLEFIEMNCDEPTDDDFITLQNHGRGLVDPLSGRRLHALMNLLTDSDCEFS